MARKRDAQTAVTAPSSELGTGDWTTQYTSIGRAIRKCRSKTKQASQEYEGASEDDNYDDSDDTSDEIAVAPSRKKTKRARSVSPARSIPSNADLADAGMTSDEDYTERNDQSLTQSQRVPAGHLTVNLTVNIPLNHDRVITLTIDPKNFTAQPDKLAEAAMARANTRSKPRHRFAGFLDLPAELKNIVYREVLVADRPINFGSPGNSFSRTSALLRTCRQVYEEGRSILYSENTFIVERRMERCGSLWTSQWNEACYLPTRKFFKSIGSENTALIRHMTLNLEDRLPCLNTSLSNEERRFVNDEELLSVLRHLIQHSQLQTLKLHFYGRKKVDRGDDRFLAYMRRIHADCVTFITFREHEYGRESKQEDCVKQSLLNACTRKHKKFDG
ncbi:uncharacterized protein RCC_00154 [Ramularia collo-cygni]|uniref:F-box domain-containing protein n=1 Tax=Ramularia collo-cygni TaxID=112498 RepID=A0A2D3UQ43_9PEZI|nr:uncharacterized protein RCC_00154 [Ramularia collo-cygni]CZT14180.1 uncharacterized protein RCC_00154 [Ramularia collo-cygni]